VRLVGNRRHQASEDVGINVVDDDPLNQVDDEEQDDR
jgi:hypothetical protein